MTDVTFQHPHYVNVFARWCKYEDAAAGEEAVKAKGDEYLPRPNPTDDSDENKERFEDYKRRAVYYNVTGRTLKSLIGLAFGKDPTLTLPAKIANLKDDVSGSGITLFQHAQRTLGEVLKTGRAGLLADYPNVEAPASVADEVQQDIRPTINFYRAQDIINWCTSKVGGKQVLSLVVISDVLEEQEGFELVCEPCFRVLCLKGGIYNVDIWIQEEQIDTAGKKSTVWVIGETYVPKQGNGRPWQEIPFTFVGAKNNDWLVDDAPLGDIANLNLAHYRNSADYEDSVWFTGQPQFFITGLTVEWRDKLYEKGTFVGSRAVMPLPVGGTLGVAQAEPNTLAKEAMDSKEKQMSALGAQLIQEQSTAKTATQQKSEDLVSHSVLSLSAENTSAAYRKTLGWCANFANSPGKVDLTISDEYTKSTLDAQTITALLGAVNSGRMAETDFWAALRGPGYIAAEKTDEMIREEIAAQEPTPGLGGLNGPDDAVDEPAPAAAAA